MFTKPRREDLTLNYSGHKACSEKCLLRLVTEYMQHFGRQTGENSEFTVLQVSMRPPKVLLEIEDAVFWLHLNHGEAPQGAVN